MTWQQALHITQQLLNAQGTPQHSPHGTVVSHHQTDPNIFISLTLLHTKSLNQMKIQVFWDTLCHWSNSSQQVKELYCLLQGGWIQDICVPILQGLYYTENKCIMILQTVRNHSPNETASHCRQHQSSAISLWQSQISQWIRKTGN
jgi:hypothetical protein